MSEKISRRDWLYAGLIIIAIAALTAGYWYPLIVLPPPVVYDYMTDLTVKFKVYDVAGTALVTANVLPEFWSSGVDPFERVFTGSPIGVGTYDTDLKTWSVALDAGSYVMTIKDTHTAGSEVYYPVKKSVTVPGTNLETLEVWLRPDKQVSIDTRATLTDVTLTSPIYPYNTTGTYAAVASATGINTTEYLPDNQTMYWFVEYRFDVSDADEITKAGRIYCSDITDFIVEKIIVDGTEYVPILDTEAADDGLTGYYAPFSDWKPGIHHVTVYVHAVTAITEQTFTVKVIENYECYRVALRYWTLVSKGITVTQ